MDTIVISDEDSDDVQFEYSDEETNEPSQGGASEYATETSPLRMTHTNDDSNSDNGSPVHVRTNHILVHHHHEPITGEFDQSLTIPNIVVDTSYADSPPTSKSDCLTIMNGYPDLDIHTDVSSVENTNSYTTIRDDSMMWL